MQETFELESLTNERFLDEVGQLNRVLPQDRSCGPGASVVMAAFTHIGNPSRFTDGSYGIYYAGRSQETAIRETVSHRERFLAATCEPPCEIAMRAYRGEVQKPLVDLQSQAYCHLWDKDLNSYPQAQSFGAQVRKEGHWGLLYPSAEHAGGECISALRPPAVSIPIQSVHLSYHWNGEGIDAVFEKKTLLITPGNTHTPNAKHVQDTISSAAEPENHQLEPF